MAEQVRNYPKLARDILDTVGGADNVSQASRCATRLRLVLNETPPEAKEKVAALPGVITVVESGGQFQVVIGPHVGTVHEEFLKAGNIDENQAGPAHNQSVVNRVIATMSGVFAPFVYILAAAGILQGALILITMFWPAFEQTGTYEVLSFMSWTPFTFLPIFIAITAAKHFRTNTFIAVLCCAAIMNPTWTEIAGRIADGESVSFLGLPLAQTVYTSTVLPPLFLVWVMSYLERAVSKRLSGVAQQIFTPLVCLLVMVPLTLVVIGPITAAGANGLAAGFNAVVNVAPAVAGALVGAFFQVAVIFGVHWAMLPMVLASHDQYGFDHFQAYQTAAVIAQVGAVIGVFLKTRNTEMKGVSGSAAVAGLFGITEPTIYGVTLRLKRPFIYGCLAGAVGGAVIGLLGGAYYAFAGLPGPLTIINASSPGTNSLVAEAIGCAIAFFGAALLTYFVGFDDPKAPIGAELAEGEAGTEPVGGAGAAGAAGAAGTDSTDSTANDQPIEEPALIASPLSGTVVPMSQVPDEVFASGAMGGGAAIEPDDTKVYAPFDGKIVTVLPSKHAIGLKSHDGVELLIHVGLDTVALGGEGFTVHVAAKQQVRTGDLLMEFDPRVIREAGYSLITPLVVTNSKRFGDVTAAGAQHVTPGEPLITVTRKAPAARQG